ncbi:vesicle-associated membrane protein-associated protein A isoform 1 [Galdieria sulphuraria]|uniref:Vesicle-associated membrane protein-associated protein A isoform 1 n=1 Tax=Galdieria sulphuraria TaxID=130081 RepID=M2WTN1_GALSU|nr:vesicle-associated membrane protein-associated protein A isoform 1 [Galdieria sulphuraria]EME27265.1 vesicle-associated membrane protein-associated protein A isoform 1 [Galdieria sulphuraria]|eukprot:XP_005703785.1 vesicle-associated membrane protein-associated protein A isoform 1 [Galdieria sulphuraria]
MDSVVKLSTKQLDLFVESGKPASTSLTVENISKSYVCFKVKTTQPQRYSVRPSVGIIKPGERKDVLITLEPLKDIPEDLKASKDRFLLQVIKISSEAAKTDVHELWKKVKEESVLQQKFRVQFVLGGHSMDLGSSSNAYSSQASLQPTERYTEGVSKGSEAYTSIYSDRFASDPLVGNGAVKQDKTKEDSKLPIDLNDSSRFTLERINLSTASSPRLLEKNHSLISLEERYQLALERIHVLNTELALRDLELEKLRDSKYGREEYRNSASSSSYEENDSEVLTARDGHFQETGEPHNRVKSSRKNTNNGLVGNIGFSVIQVFLIVLISFFFGKYLS